MRSRVITTLLKHIYPTLKFTCCWLSPRVYSKHPQCVNEGRFRSNFFHIVFSHFVTPVILMLWLLHGWWLSIIVEVLGVHRNGVWTSGVWTSGVWTSDSEIVYLVLNELQDQLSPSRQDLLIPAAPFSLTERHWHNVLIPAALPNRTPLTQRSHSCSAHQ